MATWDDVRRLALGLPEATELTNHAGNLHWKVKDKLFVWERPLKQGDLDALGKDAPTGPVLGVRVAEIGEKDALIADSPDIYFTIPHFNGYPAVLVRLDVIDVNELRELITDAWLARAPARLARGFLAGTE